MTNAYHQFDAAIIFNREFDKAIADQVERSGFPVDDWFRNGRSKPAEAIKQWRDKGVDMVERYIAWYEESGYQVWIAPDGRPAIELELLVKFGEIPVKMYIDLILVNEYGLCVVDLKSGAKRPEVIQQLGWYACGVELAFKVRPLWGGVYLGRGTGPASAHPDDKVYFQSPIPLTAYELSVPYFTAELAAMERAIEADAILSNMGDNCDRCGVAWACPAVGGIAAPRYDTTHPDYAPF